MIGPSSTIKAEQQYLDRMLDKSEFKDDKDLLLESSVIFCAFRNNFMEGALVSGERLHNREAKKAFKAHVITHCQTTGEADFYAEKFATIWMRAKKEGKSEEEIQLLLANEEGRLVKNLPDISPNDIRHQDLTRIKARANLARKQAKQKFEAKLHEIVEALKKGSKASYAKKEESLGEQRRDELRELVFQNKDLGSLTRKEKQFVKEFRELLEPDAAAANPKKKKKRKKNCHSNTGRGTESVKAQAAPPKPLRMAPEAPQLSSDQQQRVRHLVELNGRRPLAEHSRVTRRWKTEDPETLRNNVDWVNGQPVHRYRHCSDEEVLSQRAKHYLPDLAKTFQDPQEREIYTYATDRGFGIMNEFFYGDGTQGEYGTTRFGIGERDGKPWVYHQYVESGIDRPVEELMRDQESAPPSESEDDEEWEPTVKCQIESISDTGVMTVKFPGEKHWLKIYPLRQRT
ncbi:MAG: hypothetical protein WB791_08900 [Waddliaceae bacterium]